MLLVAALSDHVRAAFADDSGQAVQQEANESTAAAEQEGKEGHEEAQAKPEQTETKQILTFGAPAVIPDPGSVPNCKFYNEAYKK